MVDISYSDVLYALSTVFKSASIYISDSKYKTITIDELIRFLKDDDTNEYRYVAEYMDCDNYSFHLMGSIHNVEWGALPFGIIWTTVPNGAHAANCFVDDDMEVWIVEPQKDTYFHLPEDWIPYLVVI